jgi:hypothetical protein
MYMGDTVSFDLYAAAVQRLTGYDPAVSADEVKLTRIGKHLGPQLVLSNINNILYF